MTVKGRGLGRVVAATAAYEGGERHGPKQTGGKKSGDLGPRPTASLYDLGIINVSTSPSYILKRLG
jgi:hypothetical protein